MFRTPGGEVVDFGAVLDRASARPGVPIHVHDLVVAVDLSVVYNPARRYSRAKDGAMQHCDGHFAVGRP